jgi:hypothetical protein
MDRMILIIRHHPICLPFRLWFEQELPLNSWEWSLWRAVAAILMKFLGVIRPITIFGNTP